MSDEPTTDKELAERFDWSARPPDPGELLRKAFGAEPVEGVFTHTFTPHVVPISATLAEDAADMAAVQSVMLERMATALKRRLYPWRFPDPNPMPEMTLLPALERVLRFLRAHRDGRP